MAVSSWFNRHDENKNRTSDTLQAGARIDEVAEAASGSTQGFEQIPFGESAVGPIQQALSGLTSRFRSHGPADVAGPQQDDLAVDELDGGRLGIGVAAVH
jgi:hypothetical protein